MCINSKFSFKSFFPIYCFPFLIFGLVGYIHYVLHEKSSPPPLHGIPLILLVSFTFIWLFFGEFRTKMTKVTVEDDFIIVRKFGGLSRDKKYLYSEIDGYKISILHSSAADNEYLYLIHKDKKLSRYPTSIIKIMLT